MLKLPGKNFAAPTGMQVVTDSLGWNKVAIERRVMTEKYPQENPDYGVRLTGDELAEHQQKYQQPHSGAAPSNEYGPQGHQGQQGSSEYGPQGGQQPGYQQPGFQSPGYQQPGYQPAGLQQPGYQQGHGAPYGQQPVGGPQLHPDMAQEPQRPRTVNIAFWSIIAAGIAHLIAQLIVVTLPNRGMSEQEIQMLDDMVGPMLAELPVDNIAGYLNSPLMTASMIAQGVIALVAYFLVALGIRNGWRSMRIIGTIFAVVSLLYIPTLASALTAVLSIAAVILGIIGIVYSWLPTSTEYFRKKAWQKAAKRAYPNVPSR